MDDDLVAIELTQGKVAWVDTEDFDLVSRFKWYAVKDTNTYYAAKKIQSASGQYIAEFMHRLILGLTDSKIYTDHIDGDGLNNTRSNLRVCTCKENCRNSGLSLRNTSGFKGVSWCKSHKKWRVWIKIDNRRLALGRFNTSEEAAQVYDLAALKHFGRFARTNAMLGLL